jgi:hypothetical protein
MRLLCTLAVSYIAICPASGYSEETVTGIELKNKLLKWEQIQYRRTLSCQVTAKINRNSKEQIIYLGVMCDEGKRKVTASSKGFGIEESVYLNSEYGQFVVGAKVNENSFFLKQYVPVAKILEQSVMERKTLSGSYIAISPFSYVPPYGTFTDFMANKDVSILNQETIEDNRVKYTLKIGDSHKGTIVVFSKEVHLIVEAVFANIKDNLNDPKEFRITVGYECVSDLDRLPLAKKYTYELRQIKTGEVPTKITYDFDSYTFGKMATRDLTPEKYGLPIPEGAASSSSNWAVWSLSVALAAFVLSMLIGWLIRRRSKTHGVAKA